MKVTAKLEYTASEGPVALWVIFTSDGIKNSFSAPMWRLTGDRAGVPCSEHPKIVQKAVDELASMAKSAADAGKLFKLFIKAAKKIADHEKDDAAFVWPELVLGTR